MPRSWPLPRKGKKERYLAVPSHAKNKGISILFILRDLLGIVKTRKEARLMTLHGDVKVNNKTRHNENFPVQVFDTVNLEKAKKNYRLEIVNRKFALKEVSSKEAETKVVKISGKKVIAKNCVQMNLDDGQNIITKEKFSVGDSAIINTKENKLQEVLALKEGANIEIVAGKHAGERGKLVGFENLVRGKNYIIKLEDRQVSLPFKTILVIK